MYLRRQAAMRSSSTGSDPAAHPVINSQQGLKSAATRIRLVTVTCDELTPERVPLGRLWRLVHCSPVFVIADASPTAPAVVDEPVLVARDHIPDVPILDEVRRLLVSALAVLEGLPCRRVATQHGSLERNGCECRSNRRCSHESRRGRWRSRRRGRCSCGMGSVSTRQHHLPVSDSVSFSLSLPSSLPSHTTPYRSPRFGNRSTRRR